MKYGDRGKIVRVKFFNFSVKYIIPFVDGYVLIICESGLNMSKSVTAKNQHNHRVAMDPFSPPHKSII